MALTADELARYSRHLVLPQVGHAGQEKLKKARILCVGAGGLGSPLLLYLAAAGVGTLGIIDPDFVDISNLQRQILYRNDDQQQPKVLAAKAHLLALNPNLQIEAYQESLTPNNALQLIAQYDYIADGSDNFATRYLVNDACVVLSKPNVHASVLQFEGRCIVFAGSDGPCYRCLHPEPPPAQLVPNCAEGGVLGVLPGLLGTLQALEIIKLILGIGHSLHSELLLVNGLSMRFQTLKLSPDPQCLVCAKKQAFDSLPYHDLLQKCTLKPSGNKTHMTLPKITVQELQALQQQNDVPFTLLDVREPQEYQICNLGGKLIPVGQLSARLTEIDRQQLCIVHCKIESRSQQAYQILHAAGFSQVKILQGGILAWAKEIEPQMVQY